MGIDVSPKEHDGVLESEDDVDEVRLPYAVLRWTFENNLWDRINLVCGTYLGEYEGEWLEPSKLPKAADLIRGSLTQGGNEDIPRAFKSSLLEAAEMMEICAKRQVRVMVSL
jgi:hypothetical protein